jgi:hypothetical protein
MRADMMKRTVVLVASGLALAGCASFSAGDLMPSFSGPTTGELTLSSEPPGAEARTSGGQACRTPCKLTLPYNSGDFTVSLSAPGRAPQIVPVTIRATDSGAASRFDPNPVYAVLEPAAPPTPAKKKRIGNNPKVSVAKKKTSGPGTAARPPASEPVPPPPSANSPPGSPWPPPTR